MEEAILLLQEQLLKWGEHYESEKIYYNGEEQTEAAIKEFAECKTNIDALKQAIWILENTKLQKGFEESQKHDGSLPCVMVTPIDTNESFKATVIDEGEYSYLLRPDHDPESIQSWDKKVCEIIG